MARLAPTLVIAGADDEAIPARHGAAIAASVAGAPFVRVDHAAHMATVERADVITPCCWSTWPRHEESAR